MIGFFKKFIDIKLLKFILVGIINTVVGMGIQFLLYNLWWHTYSWGDVVSSVVSYIIGSVVSYFLNKHFTFKNKEKGWRPVFRFALNIAVCWTLAYVVAKWGATLILAETSLSQQWQGNIVLMVVSVLFVAFNYFGQRFFAFKEKEKK